MSDLLKSVNIDIDSTVDFIGYKEGIIENIQTILRHNFPDNVTKQRISEHHDRISFACPVCGDSVHDSSKKRCNLILKGKYANYVKCFNCGYFSKSNNFFKYYGITLSLGIVNYISNNFSDINKSVIYEPSFIFDTHYINNVALDREYIKKRFKCVEIDGTYASLYLKNRKVYRTDCFLYDIRNNEIIVLNLTDEKRILGFQRRCLNKNVVSKYRTYKLSKIYQLCGMDTTVITEDIDALSCIFNVCLVDWSKQVTAFEGPIDSTFFKNSVGVSGVHKGIKFDLSMRYWLDNDEAGIKKSIELLEKGNSVFLWGKFMLEYNIPNRRKWDLNDLIIYLDSKSIKVKNFDKYFSNSLYDIIDI